ncbi:MULTISPECIES: O-antigen ligase [unclassified Fibrobacter]|uniref:O-antigen ligase family protein n=1 Tax=unclassified Fibrobacter TaxID=2634177 RepID=UPI001304DAD3|nr:MULTISPECIES: O-antigen ligase family protein [unclassified Fibrobacter]
MNIFSVYLMLATGALLTFQSINFESLKHAFLNVVTVIATTGLALFLLHSLDLLPTVHVYKHGSSIPYMMFAFNNFGWFNSFNRLAGPYWEPGAFQIILNYTLLIFFEDLSKLRLAKNDALKLLIIVFAVIMTKSTTGYIFLAIFSIFVIFNSKMTKKNVVRFLGIGLAIVFSCFAIFSSDTIQKKFDQKGEKGSSYEIRQADNLAMLQMTIERPFVGYGIVSNEFRQRGKVLGNVTSSNGPLAITSQIGIPFFLLLLFFNHKALKQLHYKRAKLLLFMIILLNSSEVFFYFPLFFIFIFINKTHNEVEK